MVSTILPIVLIEIILAVRVHEDPWFLTVQLFLGIGPMFLILSIQLIYLARINRFFNVAQKCLQKLELKVCDILSFSEIYLGEDRIVSQNRVLQNCVDTVKEETRKYAEERSLQNSPFKSSLLLDRPQDLEALEQRKLRNILDIVKS